MALLALEDGTIFHGEPAGADGQACGEVVFNTAMTGYQEILTDPSYCRQLVTLRTLAIPASMMKTPNPAVFRRRV